MKAMLLKQLGPLAQGAHPLEPADVPTPEPGPGEVLIKVSVCGVCHTELDEIEARTPPPILPVIPGHQVVGRVEELGSGASKRSKGERVGVGWIHSSNGAADENLSPEFRATGRDVDGGYAEYMTVPEDYCYPIPGAFSDEEAAPLLCAGAVGYRALKLTGLRDGQRLGLTGFGGSGHLVLKMVAGLYPDASVYVFARDAAQRRFARQLGAVWAGDTDEPAPDKLDAIIDTTPAWKPIIRAMENLKPGGRLVINAIRKEDADQQELLQLNYHEHLWMEREIKSVANVTHHDIAEFLPIAARVGVLANVETYPLEEANRALIELKRGSVEGAKVLIVDRAGSSRPSS